MIAVLLRSPQGPVDTSTQNKDQDGQKNIRFRGSFPALASRG